MVVVPGLLILAPTFVLQVYYDYFNDHAYRSTTKGKEITVPAELHQIPLFIRGGSIIPTRERPRRSSPSTLSRPSTPRSSTLRPQNSRRRSGRRARPWSMLRRRKCAIEVVLHRRGDLYE